MYRYLILVLSIVFISTPVFAEQWIKCIDTTIGAVNYEKPQRVQGDCLALGLCSGTNNTGLATNVFEAVGSEWSLASQANKKCDRLASAGSRVIDLTAQEISDIADALASQNDSSLREGAKAQYDGQTESGQVLRCLVEVILSEVNIVRGWTVSFKGEVASSSNLSDLKTRVAGLPNLNDRTLAQAKTAIQSCIDNGDVDE